MQVRERKEHEKSQEGDTKPKKLPRIINFTKMAPLKESTPVPNKAHTKESPLETKVEETLKTSSLESRFPRDYIPPRKDDSPPVTLPKNEEVEQHNNAVND
jgi:hypothetical protein